MDPTEGGIASCRPATDLHEAAEVGADQLLRTRPGEVVYLLVGHGAREFRITESEGAAESATLLGSR